MRFPDLIPLAALALALVFLTTACGRVSEASSREPSSSKSQPATTHVAALAPRALPLVVVHKDPSCTCCGAWVEHLRKSGFQVEVRNSDNLIAIKDQFGVPPDQRSCHTAEVGGYFIEGHVPAADIKRLLAQKPNAKGLAVPGMPAGSPGMTSPDGTSQPYTVELIGRDGSASEFAQH